MILNLAYPEKSKIKYKVQNFPDGQQDIVIDTQDFADLEHFYKIGKDLYEPVQIKSRFNNFKDLELIICATKALRRITSRPMYLHIPYLLGARSDRLFVDGGNSYLVDVVAPIINSLNFRLVYVMDVHSDVAAACINNLVSSPPWELYNKILTRDAIDNGILISPDAGSLKKIYKIAKHYGYTRQVVVCSKYRDEKGDLSKTHVPIPDNIENENFFIIDDICDGGRTFVNIADAINSIGNGKYGLNQKHLIVTHGIFSAGLIALRYHFSRVHCTNSYSDINDVFVNQVNIF